MFFASLLFCWVGLNGPECLVAQDTYGPYPTDKQCQARLTEMATAIKEEMPYISVKGRLCEDIINMEKV